MKYRMASGYWPSLQLVKSTHPRACREHRDRSPHLGRFHDVVAIRFRRQAQITLCTNLHTQGRQNRKWPKHFH